MTVRELIAKLQELPPEDLELEVQLEGWDDPFETVGDVERQDEGNVAPYILLKRPRS